MKEATRYISGLNPADTAISVVSRAEILVGVDEAEEPLVKSLLDQYNLLVIDGPVADQSAILRRRYGWKLPDAFQAALSLHHNIRLVTRNTRDFDPKAHPLVDVPYRL
jgi:predicted nucleic acid-binding protein